MNHLLQEFDHVSYERVLSGPGLVNIYRFMAQHEQRPEEIDTTHQDAAAAISQQAMAGSQPLALATLNLFMEIYGAQALSTMARGGLYIAGGIAPKILAKFADSDFLKAFHRKGRMTHLMAQFPIRIVLAPQPGLMGAARVASLYI